MLIAQKKWTRSTGWRDVGAHAPTVQPQLVLAFGSRAVVTLPEHYAPLRSWYPQASIVMCSTAGEIIGDEVLDDSLVVSALQFQKGTVRAVQGEITHAEQSEAVGAQLAKQISQQGLAHALVFSEGLKINGTGLVKGMLSELPLNVSVTGGLVGDGANFTTTVAGLDAVPTSGKIVLIGLYGPSLHVGYGSLGGWDAFGPERIITKAQQNVLYELDDRPALDLYEEYLGDQAAGLPGTGLLFPLELTIIDGGTERRVVRTLLAIDKDKRSMTFAGDMPEGARARLMKANFDRLIDGAGAAAALCRGEHDSVIPEFALLVSCVGRKLVLKGRTEEEVEAVHRKLSPSVSISGFYSYGEICPGSPTERQCQLHNQTMTITTLRES
jgi:hypothetical protein